jgi:hypothetical protein
MDGIRFQSGEGPQDYTKLKAALFAEYKPRGRSQEKLMKSVAKALWKIGERNDRVSILSWRSIGESRPPRTRPNLQRNNPGRLAACCGSPPSLME